MSSNTSGYVIIGGADGKNRLNLLSSIMQPFTRELLERSGIGSGAHVLDMGCGGGNVSLMVARMVGPEGRVLGIDFDPEIIRLAEQDREAEGIQQLDYLIRSADEIDYRNAFDFVYARFLLSHLSNPLVALQRMYDAVKPGGKIIVEDIHFSGHVCYPPDESFQQYINLYQQVVARRGGDAELGPKIPGLFGEVGIQDVNFDIVQPCFKEGDGKWIGYVTFLRIRDALLGTGLVSHDSWESIAQQMEAFTQRQDSIISLPRIFRVWGTK
jgi:SAM-dependent methyltransferase